MGVTAVNGPQSSYTEDFLPDDTLRSTHSAMEGAYIANILVYEIILAEVLPREAIGSIAGKRISDNGSSPPVGRELCGFYTIAIQYRNSTKTYLTANMNTATEAIRFLDARPDLGWEHP